MSYGIKGASPGYGQGIRGNLGFLLIASILGKTRAARIAKMAMTMRSSIKEKTEIGLPWSTFSHIFKLIIFLTLFNDKKR